MAQGPRRGTAMECNSMNFIFPVFDLTSPCMSRALKGKAKGLGDGCEEGR